MRFLNKCIPFSLVLILSIFTVLPLFHSGFFSFHDDTQVQRVYEMGKALGDGLFPVRWVSDLGYGYGYPIFNFYAPFAYYIGGFLMLLGFNALVATKIMIGLGMITAGFTMYLFGKKVWGEWGGAVSGILYLFAPYHALNLYVRGDIAELWAYAFLPLVFLGIIYCNKHEILKGVVVGGLGFGLVVVSHNLTALMFYPFVGLILLILIINSFLKKDFLSLKGYFLIPVLGLLLSAFYWLPVFPEMKYTNVLSQIGGGADFRDHFVCLPQLWNSPWGFGGSTRDCFDGLSFRIGKLHIGLLALSFLTSLIFYKKHKEKSIIVVLTTFIFAIGCFFLLPASKPIWEIIKPMEFFQYPWRFLMVLAFCTSFSGGFIVVALGRLKFGKFVLPLFFTLFISTILFLYLKLFTPQTYNNISSSDYISKNALQWTTSKISDEYMPVGFIKPRSIDDLEKKLIEDENGIAISLTVNKTGLITGRISASDDTDVNLNLAYFPSWKLFVDNKEESLIMIPNGMKTSVKRGTHVFSLQFVQTAIEELANILTLCGFAALLAVIIYFRQNDKRSQKTT